MSRPFVPELHEILLRGAGWLPDDVLADTRARLAKGHSGEVAQVVAFAGKRTVVPLTEDDLDVLDAALEADGLHRGVLEGIELTAENTPLLWRFSAESPEPAGTDEDTEGALVAALAERELVSAVASEPGARGLWCAWRTPVDDAPYPRPRLVYVAEVDDDAENAGEPADFAAALQGKLVAAGERDPQVEVVSIHVDPPEYQRVARSLGRLLWAAVPEPEITVARIFDEVDSEEGPRFAPDRPRITDEAERARLVDYLKAGAELLATTGTLPDIVDPGRGDVVPASFRTDGSWVWTDTVTYYLEEHHVSPDPDLLQHIQASQGPPPRPDTVALDRARAALRPSDDRQPVWTTS
ncbi:hypothetical protein [Amycolatopsis pigmentata]|uniref:SUKH-4 immunity protein of toxin-antitoxin system n=1 Tax=Amycolatopsis pigmentata TaxID=450801 RepID=A0ABW5FYI0_9PSEU